MAALKDLKKAGKPVDDINVILDHFKESNATKPIFLLLTSECTERQQLVYSHQFIEISDVRPPLPHASDFTVDLLKLMTDPSFSDVAFRLEGKEPIKVHKFMLSIRSLPFNSMFSRFSSFPFDCEFI